MHARRAGRRAGVARASCRAGAARESRAHHAARAPRASAARVHIDRAARAPRASAARESCRAGAARECRARDAREHDEEVAQEGRHCGRAARNFTTSARLRLADDLHYKVHLSLPASDVRSWRT